MLLCIGVHVDYHFMDPSFSINNVSVVLLLNETSHEIELGTLFYYNVTHASLSQVKIQPLGRSKFQFTVPYNTQINVSIVARLCGEQGKPTIISLNYSKYTRI